jgi:hypothetical protein
LIQHPPVDHIILTSDEPWCDVWHTQLHYANQLSKRTDVFFLGPPSAWKISNLFSWSQTSYAVNPHLTVVNYFNWIPAGLGKIALYINDKINAFLLKRNHLQKSKYQKGIIWHFDPHRSFFLFKGSKMYRQLFHVIDPIAGCNLDIPLSKLAELVVITSPKFRDHYFHLNQNVIQIGQGVDIGFYREPDSGPASLTEHTRDSILLLGTITDQLHFPLLKKIATLFQGKLVLIGPDHTRTERGMQGLKNLLDTPGVKWLGAMPPAEFRRHLKACRVGIIAYDSEFHQKNNMRSPLKVISYLVCGKCVISNIDCEIPELDNKAIYRVNSDEDYFKLINKSYDQELEFDQPLVDRFLERISYDHLLGEIFDAMKETLPERR